MWRHCELVVSKTKRINGEIWKREKLNGASSLRSKKRNESTFWKVEASNDWRLCELIERIREKIEKRIWLNAK